MPAAASRSRAWYSYSFIRSSLRLVRLMFLVTLMPRGHTRVHSKWFSQAHTPSGLSSTALRASRPVSRLSKTKRAAWTIAAGPMKRGFFSSRTGQAEIAGRAEDALGRVVEGQPLLRGLQPLPAPGHAPAR